MYDLDVLIWNYEKSIKYLEKHKEDAGIKDTTIERHVATLNYLKELKELKEKLDNPTGQVIVADHYNDTYDIYKRCTDLESYSAPKPGYTNWYYKLQDRKIKKIEFNGPATIIFWDDNTKTVVKNYESPEYDREKGILYAALKKLATKKEYDNILRTIDKGRTNYEWI